jgi:hypothetical protein
MQTSYLDLIRDLSAILWTSCKSVGLEVATDLIGR